jgi:heme exporter protein CcmD
MTHLPYIIPSYAITVLVVGWLSIGAWARMRRTTRKLAAIDTRAAQRSGR